MYVRMSLVCYRVSHWFKHIASLHCILFGLTELLWLPLQLERTMVIVQVKPVILWCY